MQKHPEISAAMPSTLTLHVYRRVVDQETEKVKGYGFYLQRKDDEQAIEAYTSRPAFMAALRKKQRQQKREATGAEAPKENSQSEPLETGEEGGGEHTRMDGGVNAEEDEWFREQMVELRERNRRDAERWALNKEPVEAGSAAVSQDDAHARQVAADEVELGSGKCALDRPDASERKRAGMETTGLSPYQSEDDLRVGVYCIGEGGRQEGMLRPHGKEWRVDVEGKCMTLKEFYDYSQVVLVCCVRCVSCSCAPV